ncbi:MAG: FAD-binding oxidoreductase [Candidatus Delongbacteria bacterium]|jgi:sarcosine oxidase subunit beta|nr:FAD-binding oxidoreductase [Candidatus Delongbacteria bacterium]
MKTYDIIIIGAGSVGLPLSYYLSKKGKKVAVIEKRHSYGRGENKAAIGGIRATHSDPAKIKIGQMSIDIVQDLEKEHGLELDWITGGYLYPVYDEAKEKALKSLLVTQKEFGLNIDWIEPKKIKKLVPGITEEGLRGGTYSPQDGSASPLKVAGAFYKLSFEAGTDFFFDEEVISIDTEGDLILSLKTNKEEYKASVYINAAGGCARELGELCGLDLPVYPDSHEGGITEPVKPFFKPMVVDLRSDEQSANFYYYQNYEGQMVFCVTPEPKILGKDYDSTSEFLPLAVRRLLAIHPRLKNIRVRKTWRGLYPMTPDGFPIVGWIDNVHNMFLAVGMCGQGFMLGPGLGKIISEMLVDGTNDYDFILKQLSLYRAFEGNEVLK